MILLYVYLWRWLGISLLLLKIYLYCLLLICFHYTIRGTFSGISSFLSYMPPVSGLAFISLNNGEFSCNDHFVNLSYAFGTRVLSFFYTHCLWILFFFKVFLNLGVTSDILFFSLPLLDWSNFSACPKLRYYVLSLIQSIVLCAGEVSGSTGLCILSVLKVLAWEWEATGLFLVVSLGNLQPIIASSSLLGLMHVRSSTSLQISSPCFLPFPSFFWFIIS